ncbi:MAG: SRPBCC domain-containing protein [Thaumarchaeota archaeon]|nr:SRPBCC domain-containing protein [Nitrososphaerota archaeon]
MKNIAFFSKEIYSEIIIRAPAEKVWQILTHFEAYSEWNTYIRSASGQASVGEKLEINTQPQGSRRLVFHPKLLKVEPNKELRWRGSSLPRFLFSGEHFFLIQDFDHYQVKFVQKEIFTGLLTPLLKRILNKRTGAGFVQMNQALKIRAENIMRDKQELETEKEKSS